MNYKLSWHYNAGRVVFALILVFFGYNMMSQSRDFYMPYLHGIRRIISPLSKNRIKEGLTYEDVFGWVVQAEGGLFMLAGLLIAMNKRVIGGIFALLAISFLLATQDNPMLIEYLKPKPRSSSIRYDDLARHISLIGAVLFFMLVDPVVDPEPLVKKKKNKAKDD